MIFTPQQYIQSPPIVMSYTAKNGFTIEELTGQCVNCDKPVENLRGLIAEHPNCTEVRFAGICHPCKIINSFHFRFYDDGRIMFQKNNIWYEAKEKSNWYSKWLKK